jgi:hypothetical protein
MVQCDSTQRDFERQRLVSSTQEEFSEIHSAFPHVTEVVDGRQ